MYKVSSDKKQRSLHHGKPADWVNGDERLPATEQAEQMKHGIRILDKRIVESAGTPLRKELIKEKMNLQAELVEFRKLHGLERKHMPNLSTFFMDCAREMLPKVQFETIKKAAERELAKAAVTTGN